MPSIGGKFQSSGGGGGGGSLSISGSDYLQDGGVDVEELGIGQILRVGKASGSGSAPYVEVFNTAGDGKMQIGCASGAYTSTVLFADGGYNLKVEDPGNANAPIAYGKVLGTTTGAVVFNGNTTGATSETTILTGTLLTNTAAPGMRVSIEASITLTAFHSSDTLTIKVNRGGVAILTGVFSTSDTGVASVSYADIIQSIGSSGSIYRFSSLSGGTVSASDVGAKTMNTTTNNTYSITAQWSSNNAGNQATVDFGFIHYKM